MKDQRRLEMDLGSDLLSLSKNGSSRPSASAHSETRDHLEQMKHGSSNILVGLSDEQVAVRVRPIWSKETDAGYFEITKVMDRKVSSRCDACLARHSDGPG